MPEFDEREIIRILREAGARFAFVHESATDAERTAPARDVDVAAWWGSDPPPSWEVPLPGGVDLAVLDEAPLWLAGRVAFYGQLLFEDDQVARVRWQADTRRIWLDERPALRARQQAWLKAVGSGR